MSSCPLVDLPGANHGPRGHSTSLSLTAEALGTYSMHSLHFATESDRLSETTTRLEPFLRLE